MRRTLVLSGWGQPHDALASVVPEAMHLDYASAGSVDEAMARIAEAGKQCERAVGWSLGGQLLVRAIAEGLLKPKSLVLLATSYQFVESPELKLGMKRDTYAKFRDNYARSPERTLNKGWELVVMDDTRADAIREQMARHDRASVLASDWLAWLDRLAGFSCKSLDFSHFPATLLVHGTSDAVASHAQSEALAEAIPGATLALWDGCGHAPHWHDAAGLTRLMKEHDV